QQPGQLLVDRAAALAVAPARRDDRTGDDPRPHVAGPAHGRQELPQVADVPVGEQQLGVRRQRMDDLATKDTVLTVADLEIAVLAEGAGRQPARQCLAQVGPVAAETGVEDGDLDAPAAVRGGVPLADAGTDQVLLLLPLPGRDR